MQITQTHEKTWRGRIVLILAMLAITLPSWGQYRRRGGLADGDHYHFGYVSGHVGYALLATHADGVMPVGNVGGGVGLGYEYRNSGLWANVGLGLSFHRSSLRIDEYTFDRPGKDTQGRSTTLHYRANQEDQVEWNFLDVPVLIGYYTHGFHIGAGVKISYAISSRTRATGTYSLSATNDNLSVPFTNIPEQGYTDYPIDCKGDNRLNVGANLIGEIGYDLLSSAPFNSTICHVLKLSFYIEYCMNNLVKGGYQSPFEMPEADTNGYRYANQVHFNPYLNTTSNPKRTVPFFAGVKITYLIGGSRTARRGFHHGCMCYN